MARYRSKDETDIAWNKMRRRMTRELDTQIADWREVALDMLLTAGWEKFRQRLEVGEILELEPDYSEWVAQALEESVTIKPVTDEME